MSIINTRIIKEIDKLKIEKNTKSFLKEVLTIEADLADFERPNFTPEYMKALTKHFS